MFGLGKTGLEAYWRPGVDGNGETRNRHIRANMNPFIRDEAFKTSKYHLRHSQNANVMCSPTVAFQKTGTAGHQHHVSEKPRLFREPCATN